LAEKIPDPVQSPGMTCSDFDRYFQFERPTPTNSTRNKVGTCRNTIIYNYFSDLCCKASIPKYNCEQNIHDALFRNSSRNYDAAVPPIDSIDNPLNVSVEIYYETLTEIQEEEGTATLFTTIVLEWVDPRLDWEVVDSSTCSNVIDVYTGHDVETATIWLPDFDLANQIDGIQSWPNTKASVYSDGTVRWELAGGLKAFCSFTGLAEIPFDTLGCQLLFSAKSRTYSKLVNYVLKSPDLVGVGVFDPGTYNEWALIPERSNQGMAFDGVVIYYNVYFRRATNHYMQNIVVPTMLLTYLSFLSFLLDLRVGERLGFGMALALVIVAQQIVTTGLTPVSTQWLWLDKFVAWSFYWVLFGVVQSVVIGFLFYIREDRQTDHNDERNLESNSEGIELVATTSNGNEQAQEARGQSLTDRQEMDTTMRSLWRPSLKTDSFILTVSLRKLDMLSLFFASVTYTAFVVTMWSTISTGAWLRDESKWFNEEDFSSEGSYYVNNDPNN